MIDEILRPDWTRFWNAINENYSDWQAKIEAFEEKSGAQILYDGLSFQKVVEYKTNQLGAIEIIVGEDELQTRTIFNPQRVFVETFDDKPCKIIEIEDKRGGKTLFYLIQPFPVLAHFPKQQALAVV